MRWRRVLGAFQIAIPVHTKAILLPGEERQLSVLRWILARIDPHSRWHKLFTRYLGQLAGRVDGLGGVSGDVQPSPTGDWHPRSTASRTATRQERSARSSTTASATSMDSCWTPRTANAATRAAKKTLRSSSDAPGPGGYASPSSPTAGSRTAHRRSSCANPRPAAPTTPADPSPISLASPGLQQPGDPHCPDRARLTDPEPRSPRARYRRGPARTRDRRQLPGHRDQRAAPGPDGYRSRVPLSSGMTAPAATPSASEMAPAA